VYKIEYDILDEKFVITKPSGSFFSLGNPYETMVDIKDFRQLSKAEFKANEDSSVRKNCFYCDASTGSLFATIERGHWFNEGMFIFML